jgi:uncharacterized RDD family membrane protein YckC
MSTNPPNAGLSLDPVADKLTIETPEQTSLDFAVAGIGSRFLALAIDVLIQIAIGIVVGIGGMFAIGAAITVAPKAGPWAGAILILFYFVLYFGYYAIFEIVWNGQTPGKRRTGIRVIKDSGRPLTPAESIGRNLMRIVDWLPAFYAVGIVCAFFTRGNKRLGDLVVGSIVVRETSFGDLKRVVQMASVEEPPVAFAGGPLGAHQLSAEESALIESFLNRRSQLDYTVRLLMAEEILAKIKPKLTLPADNSLSTEKILEALAYERRATGVYS